MEKKDFSFDQLMEIYNHIGEEERHFNGLELEYRKLASHWLLVSLGAIGFVLTKKEVVPVDIWVMVIGICIAASVGILVIWFLDMKVYHELLHAAFSEGVKLEQEFPEFLPQIRINMVKSQLGGDIIRRVMLYYFFSIQLLVIVANIAVWMYSPILFIGITVNVVSMVCSFFLFKVMRHGSSRKFDVLAVNNLDSY
jgi:hypothetical protein